MEPDIIFFIFYANLQYLLCPFALMQKNEKIKAAYCRQEFKTAFDWLNLQFFIFSTIYLFFVHFFASPKKEPKKGAFYEGVF